MENFSVQNLPIRMAIKSRISTETRINLKLTLDGSGNSCIHTGFGLLDHMLQLIIFWGQMDLELLCEGDLEIDAHHSVEDCGMLLGFTLLEALGDRKGIERTGFGRVPMDEALAEVTVDISGRPWLEWRGDELLPPILVREEKDIWREFYKAFASSSRMNLHISFLYGKNGHHLLESVAKSLGIALRQAIRREGVKIRSTKGGLD